MSLNPRVSPLMLVTDLDSTLTGNEEALGNLLAELRQIDVAKLIYATGRAFRSALNLMVELCLPVPAALVSSVGTEIYYSYDECAHPDSSWTEEISKGWYPDRVRSIAETFRQLELQPENEQTPFKISYFLSPEHSPIVFALEHSFWNASVAAQVVYCDNRNLDLLPCKAGKGAAVLYLQRRWGLSDEEVITCGDSANDKSMLALNCRSILVGNAPDELRSSMAPCPNVYCSTSYFADGVVEGLKYWRVF